MVANNLLNEVLALPPQDRLELFDRLRESLLNDPALSSLSGDQRRILDERLDEFERDPEEGSTWDDVEARILASLGKAP